MQSKVVIIGSGPAGLTAAIYTARANLEPLIIRGLQPGGLITTTSEVENFPGFPEGIGGFDLTDKIAKQAERFGTRFLDEVVMHIDLSQRPFTLVTDAETVVKAETLIISTGASPRKLGVPGENKLANRGVSYCATCDGFFFRGKKVLVIGGGNSALDESLFLTRFASEVVIIHRRDEFRGDPILQERIFDHPKIKVLWDTVVTEILGDEKVSSVSTRNVKTEEETTIPTDGVFIYVGHVPNTEIFKNYLTMDENGYLITDGRTRTNVPGVFAAGDVADHRYRQAITSAGQGCMAGMEAMWFLDEQEHLAKKAQQVLA